MKIRLLRWWLWGWHDFIPLVPFYSVDVAHVQDGPRTFVVASLLSALTFYNSLPAAADLVEDDIGCGFPDERSWFVVPVG